MAISSSLASDFASESLLLKSIIINRICCQQSTCSLHLHSSECRVTIPSHEAGSMSMTTRNTNTFAYSTRWYSFPEQRIFVVRYGLLNNLSLLAENIWYDSFKPLCTLASRLVRKQENIILTFIVLHMFSSQFLDQPSGKSILLPYQSNSNGADLDVTMKKFSDAYPKAYRSNRQILSITPQNLCLPPSPTSHIGRCLSFQCFKFFSKSKWFSRAAGLPLSLILSPSPWRTTHHSLKEFCTEGQTLVRTVGCHHNSMIIFAREHLAASTPPSITKNNLYHSTSLQNVK